MTATENPYPESIADEDYQFLINIVHNLSHDHHINTVELPHGFVLTNKETGGGSKGSFAGIDLIRNSIKKISDAGTEPLSTYQIVMPSDEILERVQIGSLFGIDVFIDPACPKDQFMIMPNSRKNT